MPLYQQVELLKKNYRAVLIGIVSGVLASLCSVLISPSSSISTMRPTLPSAKSITTAIGIGVSEELGGHVSVSVVCHHRNGCAGQHLCREVPSFSPSRSLLPKVSPSAVLLHALGTAKAMEMGTIEGAMSSLSIVVCGVMTVIGSSIFALFM